MSIRAVFFGTPDFARSHLEALLNSSVYRVCGVVSQPDRPSGRKMQLQASPVKQLALLSEIPVETPESLKDPAFLSKLQSWRPDVCVVVAYGQIFPRSLLAAFPKKVVNVHASLLPRWRGAAPIQRALMEGDKESGVCLQVMVPELDAGDLIGTRKLRIADNMDAIQLHEAMKPLGAELLLVELPRYLTGKVQPEPQNSHLVTYAKKIEKTEAAFDWSKTAEQLFNQFRGLALGPGVKTSLNGKGLRLSEMTIGAKGGHKGAPGEILDVSGEGLLAACGEGMLNIKKVQPESRQSMMVAEFLRGYPVKQGDFFGK